MEALLEARRRHIIIVSDRKNKYFMDHLSNVDFDGRQLYRYPDLGLQPSLVQLAASLLGHPLSVNTVDMMACRSTRQTQCYVSRYPDSDPHRLHMCDIQNYDLGMHPALKTKDLYVYPPEIMLPRVVQQIIEQQRVGQVVLLVYPLWLKGHSWLPDLEGRIGKSVLIPHDDRNWVHPGGAENTDASGLRKWPLIISSLFSGASTNVTDTLTKPSPFAKVMLVEQEGEPPYRSVNLQSS